MCPVTSVAHVPGPDHPPNGLVGACPPPSSERTLRGVGTALHRNTKRDLTLLLVGGLVGSLVCTVVILSKSEQGSPTMTSREATALKLNDERPGGTSTSLSEGKEGMDSPVRMEAQRDKTGSLKAAPGLQDSGASPRGSSSDYDRLRFGQLESAHTQLLASTKAGDAGARERFDLMLAAITIILDHRGLYETIGDQPASAAPRSPREFRFASGNRLYSFDKSSFAGFEELEIRAALDRGVTGLDRDRSPVPKEDLQRILDLYNEALTLAPRD